MDPPPTLTRVSVFPVESYIGTERVLVCRRNVVFATLASGYEGTVIVELVVDTVGTVINRKLAMSPSEVNRSGDD